MGRHGAERERISERAGPAAVGSMVGTVLVTAGGGPSGTTGIRIRDRFIHIQLMLRRRSRTTTRPMGRATLKACPAEFRIGTIAIILGVITPMCRIVRIGVSFRRRAMGRRRAMERRRPNVTSQQTDSEE